VRTLDKAKRHLNRSINAALLKNDLVLVGLLTKSLALAFNGWAEANLSKLIHTPYGFDDIEMEQIKAEHRKAGIGAAWTKCIQLGLSHVQSSPKSNYLPNIRQKLARIAEQYVIAPYLLRNKIAHGQWSVALNRENTAINPDTTQQLRQLDVVTVNNWFDAHRYLARVVEALVESPDGAFHRDVAVELSALEEFEEKSRTETVAGKIAALREKTSHRPIGATS